LAACCQCDEIGMDESNQVEQWGTERNKMCRATEVFQGIFFSSMLSSRANAVDWRFWIGNKRSVQRGSQHQHRL
jgi:hypothetical protein